MNYDNLFSDNNSDKRNYIARLLGIFSETIVSFWLDNEKCSYESLGRPIIYDKTNKKLATLDFTLKNKKTGHYYIAEQKTWLHTKMANFLI